MSVRASVGCSGAGGSTAPGAASAARAGVSRLVLLGDPPSFDEDDSDPHCCVKPLDAVAVPSLAATAARRSRRWPQASCSAPMASWLRCSLHRTTGMPPWPPRPPRSPRQFRLRSRTCLVPSCPASRQKVSRSRPPAVSGCPCGPACANRRIPSIRPRRLSAAWRIRAQCRCISPATPECASIPGWHLGVGNQAMVTAPLPDSRRLSGLPVCRNGSRQRPP